MPEQHFAYNKDTLSPHLPGKSTKHQVIHSNHIINHINMAFSQSAQDFRLEGSLLIANIFDDDGNIFESVLDINEFVGNNDGYFDLNGSGFFDSVYEESSRLDGTTLITVLYREDGSVAEEQFLNLDDYIANENGSLVFR
jgi:hypothetical protein